MGHLEIRTPKNQDTSLVIRTLNATQQSLSIKNKDTSVFRHYFSDPPYVLSSLYKETSLFTSSVVPMCPQ